MVECHLLRLGHRPGRDKRLTTHVALTARALGARSTTIHRPDPRITAIVADVTQRLGGDYQVAGTSSPKRLVHNWEGGVAHLTMYGTPLGEVAPMLRRLREPLLLVVGAEKVPTWLYQAADWNIAAGHQPHSEVAALALALAAIMPDWEQAIPTGELAVAPGVPRGVLAPIPDAVACLALHRRHSTPAAVVAHCQAVAELATAVTTALAGNVPLASAGALLHDLGRARTHTLAHVAEGATLLQQEQTHPGVVHIVRSHAGGGLTRTEARRVGLPPGDYLPRTLEARVVTACDNLFHGTERREVAACVEGLRRAGLVAGARRVARLHRWVSRRLGEDLDGFEA